MSKMEAKMPLDWALEYASLGWAVFPLQTIRDGHCTCPGWKQCGSPGKHPLTGHGVKDATTDAGQVARWWNASPRANIAIATGSRSGILVVDADVHSGGMERLEQFALPDTRRVRTGSGGLHFYYHCQKVMPGQTNLAVGVHAKGDGGYVVAPPGLHLQGQYRWLNPETYLVDAPAWLPAWRAERSATVTKREGWVEELLTESCPEGQRNETLTRLSGYFRNVLPEGVTLAILSEWNEHHCSPPLSDFEVRQNVQHKYRIYAPGRPPSATGAGRLMTLPPVDDPELGTLYERLLPANGHRITHSDSDEWESNL